MDHEDELYENEWEAISELLSHLGLEDRNWTWRHDTSQGMSIVLTVGDN